MIINSDYWRFRLAFYRQTIKEMREAILQLGAAVVVLFQVAIPAVFLFFLMGLGQLADPGVSPSDYAIWLGGYGILMYCLMRFQRNAILALPIKFWDSGLPIETHQRIMVLIGLCMLAGNVFLLLPIGLLLYLWGTHLPESLSFVGFKQLWPLLLSCFWGIHSTIIALHRQRFPLLILVILPILIWLLSLNTSGPLWLLFFLLGPVLGWKGSHKAWNVGGKLGSFWQLLLAYQFKNWQSFLLKITALILSLRFFTTMLEHTSFEAKNWVVLCCIFMSATLASTIQFNLTEFKQQYGYFLSSLPISRSSYRRQILSFIGVFGILFLCLTCLAVGFTAINIILWSMFYVVGIWSVDRLKQRFFIPLIILFCLFGILLAQTSAG